MDYVLFDHAAPVRQYRPEEAAMIMRIHRECRAILGPEPHCPAKGAAWSALVLAGWVVPARDWDGNLPPVRR